MSYAVGQQVIERSRSRGLCRLVLMTLADLANHDGTVRCSAELLARRAALDIDELPNLMYELGSLGELRVVEGGAYKITLPPAVSA